MKLEVTEVQGSGFAEVTASHRDKKLVFSTATYGKVRLQDPYRVFDEINGYWASLDAKTQDAIWDCYEEIREFLDESLDTFHTMRYLRKHISDMYTHMSMDSFSKWLLTKGNLYIPGDIQDSISEDSRYPRADQTYLKEDYINLAALALSLRPLLPIWGEFIDPSRQSGTSDRYKEMEAVGLIANTDIITWPRDNSAFDKLQNYIRIYTEDKPVAVGNLWRGIGSSELPLWLQAKVMVRRMTIVPLCDHTVTHSIIANIYNYVQSNMKPTDRRIADRVTDKIPQESGSDEDDKTSFLEGYKVKQRVTTGDAVLFNVYSENMAGIAQSVDPTIDLTLLDKTTAVIPKVLGMRVHEHQIRIAQWVLAKGYPPRAFYQVNKASVNRLLATAQALLWHWGFLDIACLLQVDSINATLQGIPGITQQPKSGGRIARKYDEELMELFPHTKPERISARRQQQLEQSGGAIVVNRSNNYAVVAINNLARDVNRYDWQYHGPNELWKLADQPEGRNIVVLPMKFKDILTDMVIHISRLNQ